MDRQNVLRISKFPYGILRIADYKHILHFMETKLGFRIPTYIRSKRKAEIAQYFEDVVHAVYRDEPRDKYAKIINFSTSFEMVIKIAMNVDNYPFTHYEWRDGQNYPIIWPLPKFDGGMIQELRAKLGDSLNSDTTPKTSQLTPHRNVSTRSKANVKSFTTKKEPKIKPATQKKLQFTELAGKQLQDTIKFKTSPYYQVVSVCGGPRICIESRNAAVSSEWDIKFDAKQLGQLSEKLDKNTFTYRVFLYMAPLKAYQCLVPNLNNPVLDLEFPADLAVTVNDSPVQVPKKLAKKSFEVPLDITESIKANSRPESSSLVKISFQSEKRIATAVYMVKTQTTTEIIEYMRANSFHSLESVLAKVKKFQADDDIVTTASTLSLICPLGQCRISVPIRSEMCSHSQCFDAIGFFELNHLVPTWQCPVCSRIISDHSSLFIDGYFEDILSKTPTSLSQVRIDVDGSWSVQDDKAMSALNEEAKGPQKQTSETSLCREQTITPFSAPALNLQSSALNLQHCNPETALQLHIVPEVSVDSFNRSGSSTGLLNGYSQEYHNSINGESYLQQKNKSGGGKNSEMSGNGRQNSQYPLRQNTAKSNVVDLTLDSDDDNDFTSTEASQETEASFNLSSSFLRQLPSKDLKKSDSMDMD